MWPLAVWVQDRWRVASLDFSACSCPLERGRERERERERGGEAAQRGQKKVSNVSEVSSCKGGTSI